MEASEPAIPTVSRSIRAKEKAIASQHADADRIGKAGLVRKREAQLLE